MNDLNRISGYINKQSQDEISDLPGYPLKVISALEVLLSSGSTAIKENRLSAGQEFEFTVISLCRKSPTIWNILAVHASHFVQDHEFEHPKISVAV